MPCCPVSFSRPLPHPALHSFPTRRSSDLPGVTTALAALPATAWTPMTLGRAKNTTRRIRVHDDPATALSAYPRPIRQLRSEEHTSELQSLTNLVCRLLLEKKKNKQKK